MSLCLLLVNLTKIKLITNFFRFQIFFNVRIMKQIFTMINYKFLFFMEESWQV